jgi:hypothetical protein
MILLAWYIDPNGIENKIPIPVKIYDILIIDTQMALMKDNINPTIV